ncbi:MAG TPA: malto-oligosyltrehalose trehalohydrolase [Rhodothermales bacterium]|nr:malto-oligosyltrehalose trehalohydrolase [Rhodothermales bacterium]
MTPLTYPSLGALVTEGGAQFRVWAPKFERMRLLLAPVGVEAEAAGERTVSAGSGGGGGTQVNTSDAFAGDAEVHEMQPEGDGFFSLFAPSIEAGARYLYQAGERSMPDPASRYQPGGVHGPSMVVDPTSYAWGDAAWQGIRRYDIVFYELHVGTFSPEGTFDGARRKLGHLRDLGVTAIELMPLGDFPGRWGWGYDVAAPFAPCRAYGAPDDLRRLIDTAHQMGLAVFVDVVYNHFGPDGAYAPALAPFFTEKHHTPWGDAVNLDDADGEHVRSFFLENAVHWLLEYHADGLRVDASHRLVDTSDPHFLAELAETVQTLEGRERYVVAEDERNLRTLIDTRRDGGYGLDGVWADDFHHLARNLAAGDTEGYYVDFASATTEDLATALRQGWYYTGQYSQWLEHPRGTDPAGLPLDRFILCIQNHDQIGNRASGSRLSTDASPAAFRALSAVLLFAPETPLLFMGQEWGATTPFQYFTDHEPKVGSLVSEGRRKEFAAFASFAGDVPDPQDPETFYRSKLNWDELDEPVHARILQLYRDLLALRPKLHGGFEANGSVDGGLVLRRGQHTLLAALRGNVTLPMPGHAPVLFHSEEDRYAERARPPVLQDGSVFFPGPAAVLLER